MFAWLLLPNQRHLHHNQTTTISQLSDLGQLVTTMIHFVILSITVVSNICSEVPFNKAPPPLKKGSFSL